LGGEASGSERKNASIVLGRRVRLRLQAEFGNVLVDTENPPYQAAAAVAGRRFAV
jgi:hypothetical protein